jgi:hypothetical protein
MSEFLGGQSLICFFELTVVFSVADPGFFTGFRIQGQKDPGSASATKNLSIFNQKIVY